MSSPRVRRIADHIKVTVAELLERRIKDPRLGFVTVTDVRVSGDTQHASVFYTVLGDEQARADADARLATAAPQARTFVASQLRLRHVPTLEFVPDTVPGQGARIDRLLAELATTPPAGPDQEGSGA